LLVSYTFAKNVDNGPAPFDLILNHQMPQSAFNLAAERGPASTDVRDNLSISHNWKLPGQGNLFGGWQFNGITSMRTGLPANVVRNGSTGSTGYQGLRPNLLADPNLDLSERTLSHYFDTAAFSTAGLKSTQPGDAGRNIIRGPGYINLDLSIFKDFRLRESLNLQARVEAYNVANTPHFANPNTDMSQGQFGSITKTIGNPRILQFALKLRF
jgi:hypothetical protein